jgi:hypothetical protein
MKKQFWITVRQFRLYLCLSQGLMVIGMIPIVISAIQKGMDKETMMDYTSNSNTLKD